MKQDPRDMFDPKTMLKNIVVFATVFSIFGVCLCLIFFGWRKDIADTIALLPELNSDKEHHRISAAEKGALLKGGIVSGIEGEPDHANAPTAAHSTSARRLVGAGRIAVMTVRGKARKRLHEVDSKMRQLHGKSAEEPLDEEDQKWLNKKTRWAERKRKRFDEEDKRAQKRMSDGIPLVYLITSTWGLLTRVMKEKHKLLSVWWVFLPSFTRPQWLLLIWVSIMGIMTVNAILYDLKNPEVDCAKFSTDWILHTRGNASSCNGQLDLLENPMCTWDNDPEKEECLYREQPLGESLAAAILTGVISALLVAPVDVVLIVGFKKVAPSKDVREIMRHFDEEINNSMTTDLVSKEQNKDAPTVTPKDVEGHPERHQLSLDTSRGRTPTKAGAEVDLSNGGQVGQIEAANVDTPERIDKNGAPCNELEPQPGKTEGSESQAEKRKGSIVNRTIAQSRKLSWMVGMSIEQLAQMRREQDPLDKVNINKAALKLIAEDDERYIQAGRRLPYMVRKQRKANKGAKVYAVPDEEGAKVYAVPDEESSAKEGSGKDGTDGEWELQALRPAPPLWKRCLMCRRKRTRGEKRWEWAVAKVTQQRKMEIELRKLTDAQRAARLLEIARVSKMPAMVKSAYNLNKLPLQPIGKPLPYVFQYIAYAIGIAYVGACGYFLLGFGVRRGADITNAWLLSMLTSLAETMLVAWPTTIFFLNVLLPRAIQPIVSKIDISEAKNVVAQHAGNLVSVVCMLYKMFSQCLHIYRPPHMYPRLFWSPALATLLIAPLTYPLKDAQVELALGMDGDGDGDVEEGEDFDVHDDNWLSDFGGYGEIIGGGIAAAVGFAASRTASEKVLSFRKNKPPVLGAEQVAVENSVLTERGVECKDTPLNNKTKGPSIGAFTRLASSPIRTDMDRLRDKRPQVRCESQEAAKRQNTKDAKALLLPPVEPTE
jgi:hypothetical protein